MGKAHRDHELQISYYFEELVRIQGDKCKLSDLYLI